MTTTSTITLDQLAAELRKLAARDPEDDGGFSSKQIAGILKSSDGKARTLIHAAVHSGILVARRGFGLNIMGERVSLPRYFLAVPAKPKGRKK
jgi:hypothetical protein